MTSDNTAPKPPAPRRASRWSPPPSPPTSTTYRLLVRLLGIPILAVAGVIIYRGLEARLSLPECDSDRAKQTLAKVLKELKLEPVRYAPINTISSSKNKIVCNAVMPLPDGANVVADYTFYWQGGKVDMHYTVRREAAQKSWLGGPTLAFDLHRGSSWTRQ
jgi:hypothetical protein